jgi:hypothetical protein
MSKMLILGSMDDPHVERVVNVLARVHDLPPVVLDHRRSTESAHWRTAQWLAYYRTIAGLFGDSLVNPLQSLSFQSAVRRCGPRS